MKTKISIFILCSFSICGLAQIPNAGFENWTVVGSYQNPDGWGTLNNKTAANSAYTATKGSPGNPGSSYLELTSKPIGGGMVNGIAVSGKLDTMTLQPKSGFAFNQRPASFGGKWQHMIFGSSQGSIMVLLSKWNSSLSQRDTIASSNLTLSGMAMSWANFSMNMTYVDSLQYPDSCIIVLKASGSAPTTNDYLWVDALAFSGTVAVAPPPNLVGIEKNKAEVLKPSLFPNPSKNITTLSFNLASTSRVSIQITDITGKIVKDLILTQTVPGINTLVIETEKLDKGLYTVTLKTSESTGSCRMAVE